MKEKIPARMYTLKNLHNACGLNWISTREAKTIITNRYHLYELRGDLENKIWNENLRNRDGSSVYAKGAMKNGNFWRISPKGILNLYRYFDIGDYLDLVAKKLLLEEEWTK